MSVDLASLAIKIDSTQAGPAATNLDKLTDSATRTEKAVEEMGNTAATTAAKTKTASQAAAEMAAEAQKGAAGATAFGRAYVTANSAIDKLAVAQAEATREIEQARVAYKAGEISLEGYNRQLLQTKAALSLVEKEHSAAMAALNRTRTAQDAANETTNAAAFASRNLTYQLTDMAQGLAMGAPPLMVLMQQLPQAADAFMQLSAASGGAGSAVAGLAAKFGPALLIVGAVAGAVALITEEINKNSDVTVTWQDTALGAYDAVSSFVSGQLTAAFEAMGLSLDDVFKGIYEAGKFAFNGIVASAVVVPRAIIAGFQALPAAIGDVFVSGANMAIHAINGLLAAVASQINSFIIKINALLSVAAKFSGMGGDIALPTITPAQIGELKNSYSGAGAQLGKVLYDSIKDTFTRDWAADAGNWVSPFTQARARKRLAEDAGKAGKAAGGHAGKQAGDAFIDAMMRALDANMVKAYEDVLSKNAAALAKAAKDSFESALKAANDNTDAAQKPFIDAAKATAAWNESLRVTINYLDQIGGVGSRLGTIGALFEGLRTGDFSSVGGKTGAFIGLLTQTDGGKALVSELRDVLDQTFGGNGQFTKKIDQVLQGAGLGLAGAQLVFGSGKTNLGGAIGGALGQALGKEVLGKALGSFAGPLGAIAGGLLGNLIGGLFSKTKKASATIGFGAGGLDVTGLTGNNSTLKTGSTAAANSVIEALMNIADQFGAGIGGNISTSIGIRKKSYRVDTTGQGRVQGAGVLDFGEDAQAAVKAAIKDAISDGVFTGLSDGIQRLLKGDGDLEAQLKKALSFQSVFDELKQRQDPTGYAMEQVDKWRASMDKIFAEAGATGEELAKLEELTGLKRAEILEQANEKALELANDRKTLEIQIMELTGDSVGALAAAREMEKAGVDASLRPLYDRIYALQDEAKETEAAAQALAAITSERKTLETQLMQLLGDTAGLRAEELAALDPSNRAIQQRIWQIEAQQAADEALNAHTKAVLDEQYGLVTQLLNLQGDTNKLRARELAALDPVNRSILEQIFALTDLKAAQDDAAKAAQEAAQVQKAIADERYGLETQLLNLLGDTATIRARELALLDPSNRALQQRIWAITDAQAAEEARVKAMQEAGRAEIKAREDQIASINDTISALSGATERWSGLAKEIREFRAGLFSGAVGSGTSYKQSEAEFRRVSKMAAFGDAGALQSFTGVSKAFLDAARDNARSLVDYQRAIGLVAGAADAAAAGADGVARQAADQIAVLMAQRVELETLNAQTQASLETLNASADVQANDVVPTLEQMVKEQQAASDDASKARAEQKVENLAMVTALNQIARILDRVSQGGESFTVATDGNSLTVTVDNTAANPVPVDTTP